MLSLGCPLIAASDPAPGGWQEDVAGRPTWCGEVAWRIQFGGTEIVFSLGQASSASAVLLSAAEYDGFSSDCSDAFPLIVEVKRCRNALRLRRPLNEGWQIRTATARDLSGDLELPPPDAPPHQLARFVVAQHDYDPVERNDDIFRHPFVVALVGHEGLRRAAQDDGVAKTLYGALCNSHWLRRAGTVRVEASHDLKGWRNKRFLCTRTSAGRLVATLRNRGEGALDFHLARADGDHLGDVVVMIAALGWRPVNREDPADDAELLKFLLSIWEKRPRGQFAQWYMTARQGAAAHAGDHENPEWHEAVQTIEWLALTARISELEYEFAVDMAIWPLLPEVADIW